MSPKHYLAYAIDYIGSQKEVAKLCGITQQAVSAWFKNGVPLMHALRLEKLTNGHIQKELLAPQYF